MIISKEYGPQLDPTDGTIGSCQLVKRWVIVKEKGGELFTHSQGRYTHGIRREAERDVREIKRVNSPDRYPATLTHEQWWCYPRHFDPVCKVPEIKTDGL